MEAHGACDTRGASIADCSKHGVAWLAVWRAKHMGVTPEQWAASSVAPRDASTFREVPSASPLAALKGAVGRLEAVANEQQPITPAEMLSEAYALLERARVLALNAYDAMSETMLDRTNGVVRFGDARQWVAWLKREAEAKHGR